MATFTYTARRRNGEKVEGDIEAADRRSAMAQVEALGHIPVAMSEQGAGAKKPSSGLQLTWRRGQARLGMRDVLLFTTELSDLLASGMTLGQALNTLANRRTGRQGDAIVASLRDEIIQGTTLSDALARHPRTFTRLYVSMIRAGEASGAMDEVLRRLVEHYERVQETKEKIVMALVYPVIVLVMGVATMIFSMVFVVPKFRIIFEQMDAALPLPTQMLIGGSAWLSRYGIFVLIGALVAGILARRAVSTKRGRRWWHGVILRTPLIRGIIASGTYSNFARTLSTLLANGVPVLQALGIVERTIGNEMIAEEIRNARERVTDGTTISGPLAAGKILPPMLTDMLAIGEQTGDMAGALTHIARRYESELDRNIKIFTTALEPMLIVVVAVLVGFVAVSILMAVFNLTNGLNV